jgi:septum formation protein
MHLILASQSAFRARLLADAGVEVATEPAHIDEAEVKAGGRAEGMRVEDVAILLAAMKAERVARRHPQALVIGADQMLVCGERWFDKPATLAEARDHLLALRGRAHHLVTAMVCQRDGQRLWQHVARPRLVMRDFSEAFLDDYLAREGEVLTTTVGAYRIEGLGMQLFDRIEGEHSEIIGLPLPPLLGFLRQHGVLPR